MYARQHLRIRTARHLLTLLGHTKKIDWYCYCGVWCFQKNI